MLKNPYFELRNPNGALVLYYGAVRMDSIRLPVEGEDDKQKRENQEKLEEILKEIPVKNVSIARMIIGSKIPDVVTFKFPWHIIEFLQGLWTMPNNH